MNDTLLPEVANDVDLMYTDSGKKMARISAPLLERYGGEKPYIEMTKGLHVTFYDKQGAEQSYLKARYGISYETEKTVLVKNDVEVRNVKGEKLNTEKLLWEQDKQKITSDAFVKITRAKEILYGNGFESNQDFTQYRIFDIKGIVSIDKDTLKSK